MLAMFLAGVKYARAQKQEPVQDLTLVRTASPSLEEAIRNREQAVNDPIIRDKK
jgi:hypothetical protein